EDVRGLIDGDLTVAAEGSAGGALGGPEARGAGGGVHPQAGEADGVAAGGRRGHAGTVLIGALGGVVDVGAGGEDLAAGEVVGLAGDAEGPLLRGGGGDLR